MLIAPRVRDGKGKRKVARLHDVPLIPKAVGAMQAMPGALGSHLFTITVGESGAIYAIVDLRRTMESCLADAGVSRKVRAQLQSPGLGGVQARHYDRHDYLQENGRRWKRCTGLRQGTMRRSRLSDSGLLEHPSLDIG